jgi:hypothetical protein
MLQAEEALKRDAYGRIVWNKCRMEHFKARRQSWAAAETDADRKRRVFADILRDDGVRSGSGGAKVEDAGKKVEVEEGDGGEVTKEEKLRRKKEKERKRLEEKRKAKRKGPVLDETGRDDEGGKEEEEEKEKEKVEEAEKEERKSKQKQQQKKKKKRKKDSSKAAAEEPADPAGSSLEVRRRSLRRSSLVRVR